MVTGKDQSISQSINQSIYLSIYLSINQSINLSIYLSIYQLVNTIYPYLLTGGSIHAFTQKEHKRNTRTGGQALVTRQ